MKNVKQILKSATLFAALGLATSTSIAANMDVNKQWPVSDSDAVKLSDKQWPVIDNDVVVLSDKSEKIQGMIANSIKSEGWISTGESAFEIQKAFDKMLDGN